MISEKAIFLAKQLELVLFGDPWYGSPTLFILADIRIEAVFYKSSNNHHSIAEILLHMISWTNEVLERINGKSATLPAKGDWPIVETYTLESWLKIVSEFESKNKNLISSISNKSDDFLMLITDSNRLNFLGSGVSNYDLVNGLIHHHIYHSGQIALLNKMNI